MPVIDLLNLNAALNCVSGWGLITYTKEGEEIVVSKMCKVRHQQFTVRVRVEDYERWTEGENIKHAFPYLTMLQREFLIRSKTPAEIEALVKVM